MAGETPITVVGNLTADPELRFTPSGAAVANFTVASTPRTFDRQTNDWKDERDPVPELFGLAAGGRERRRVPDPRHAGHRLGSSQGTVLRDPRGREAHRLRDRRRRGRAEPEVWPPPRSPKTSRSGGGQGFASGGGDDPWASNQGAGQGGGQSAPAGGQGGGSWGGQQGGGQGAGAGSSTGGGQADPWATPSGGGSHDEPPF